MDEGRRTSSRRPRRRPLLWAAATLLLCGVSLGATGWAEEWWQKWSSTEEDLGDGRVHLTVTGEDGTVAFDETLEADQALLVTDDDEFLVLEPSDPPDDGVVDEVLSEIAADEAARSATAGRDDSR